MNLCGAILVGGRSSRMGADKATLVLSDGRTMLEHVAAAMRQVCKQIVLVGSASSPRHAGGYMTVADARKGVGPLAGIEALLASNLADEYLVCPCDVPAIAADVLRELLRHRDASATVFHVQGRADFDPLPGRISAAALPMVRELLDRGERSVWRLMQQLPAAVVELEAGRAVALRNINTPDDLNTL